MKEFFICVICLFYLDRVTSQNCNGARIGESNPKSKDKEHDTGVSGRHYLNCDYSFTCCGIIDECEFYTEIAGTLEIQIWRPTGVAGEYELVGEYAKSGAAITEELFNLATSDQLTVTDGDCLGWYSTGEDMVTYDTGGGSSPFVYQYDGLGNLATGAVIDWSGATTLTDRQYAINCRSSQGSAPTFLASLPTTDSVLDNTSVGITTSTVTVTDSNTFDTLTVTMSNTYFGYTAVSNTVGNVEVISALSPASGTTQTLSFTVTDNCGNTDTYSLAIAVVNDPPVLSGLPTSVDVSEDASTQVSLYLTTCTDTSDNIQVSLTAQDPNTTPLKFVVKQDATNVYSVYTTFSPDFNHSAVSSYDLTLGCTDQKDSDSGVLTVYLIPNQVPVITNLQSPTTARISTNTSASVVIYTVTHTDVENDTVFYSISFDSPCPFEITNSGDIQATQPLSSVTQTSCEAIVTISDSKGVGIPRTLTIEISDINDIPLITNMSPALPVVVSENSALSTPLFDVEHQDTNTLDTITYSLSASPTTDIFEINTATGVISTSSTNNINFEDLTNAVFTLTVSVSDGKNTTTADIQATVLDVNEPLIFNQNEYTVVTSEGQPAGTALPNPPLSWTDPDAGDNQTCYLTCASSGSEFVMNARTCIVTFANVYSLDEGKPSSVICTVSAVDLGDNTATASYTISITDVNNYTPSFFPNSYHYFISENSATGTSLGTIVATDQDANAFGNIAYSLDQTSLAVPYYNVNATTGVVTLENSLIACNCSSTVHTILAVATDDGLQSSTATIKITVLEVTTTTVAATTDYYKTFFQSSVSSSWFAAVVILAAVVLATSIFILFKYVRGWPRNLCRRSEPRRPRRYPRYERDLPTREPPHRDQVQVVVKKIFTDSVRNPPPDPRLQAWRNMKP